MDHGPEPGSVEHWALEYLRSDTWADKLVPPAAPTVWRPPTVPLSPRPGRSPAFRLVEKGNKTPGREALKRPERRARLLHTFLHHELQAAELMCWALLRFPEAPLAFRRGLLRIAQDEVRHMGMYAAHIEALGYAVGGFAVNDWFWERLAACATPTQFVATMGLGFEGGNLDHTQRFAARFREVGDEAGARLQERVGEEEVSHVAFAAHWFTRFEGALRFADWRRALPAPLSPMLMRGRPINRRDRLRAGLSDRFVDELGTWQHDTPGC